MVFLKDERLLLFDGKRVPLGTTIAILNVRARVSAIIDDNHPPWKDGRHTTANGKIQARKCGDALASATLP